MCLGVPAEVVSLCEGGPLPTGVVDFGGARREVCLAYVPEARVGDFVVVHVGFAISMVDRDEATRTWALLAELDMLEVPDGAGGGDGP